MDFQKQTDEIKEGLEKQRLLVREVINELNGKVMDYESCRILEDFLNDYLKGFIGVVQRKFEEISKDYKIVKKVAVT